MLISANTGLYSARNGAGRIPMAQGMDFFASAGFEAVDVNFCAVIYPEPERHEPVLDGDWRKNIDQVLARIQHNHLEISHTHLPFFHYLLPDRETLAYYHEMTFRAIEATTRLGAQYAVVHPFRNEQNQTLIEQTVSLLAPFQEAAAKHGVTLCVENMNTTTAQELCQIVDLMGCAACWDVGHANLFGLNQSASIRTLGKRLQTLHLHDNYGVKDDHSLPFLGSVDWQGVMQALQDIQYPGTFNYEVNATHIPMELRMDHARYLVDAAKLLLGRERERPPIA